MRLGLDDEHLYDDALLSVDGVGVVQQVWQCIDKECGFCGRRLRPWLEVEDDDLVDSYVHHTRTFGTMGSCRRICTWCYRSCSWEERF
mmetsp:Transcript_58467/g.132155  ORF Transcript_58467/g.132155 Transcript_58467/m.132155 type:complete len:88 (+) Transcript_58467:524-787(+)